MRVREKASLGTFDVVYRVKPTIYFFKVIRRGVDVVKRVHYVLGVMRKIPFSLHLIHGTWEEALEHCSSFFAAFANGCIINLKISFQT